jgi:hypothetical protein
LLLYALVEVTGIAFAFAGDEHDVFGVDDEALYFHIWCSIRALLLFDGGVSDRIKFTEDEVVFKVQNRHKQAQILRCGSGVLYGC